MCDFVCIKMYFSCVTALDKMAPAGAQRQTSAEDKRLVKESVNPLKLHFPHGKHRSGLNYIVACYLFKGS